MNTKENKMRFAIIAILSLFLMGAASKISPSPNNIKESPPLVNCKELIELRYRPGGSVIDHILQARIWHKRGACIVIKDIQYSAAGLAILEMKKLGTPMCYGPKTNFNANPVVKLHQTKINAGTHWVFRDDALGYGWSSPINGRRTVTMQELKIPKCPMAYKPTRIIAPGIGR